MLQQVLQEYGLSAKEADLYLVCLELGSAPASTIARRLGENRVTVYSNLKNLVRKGIITQMEKKNTTYYSAISAKQLLLKIEQKLKIFKDALPAFISIEGKSSVRPKIQFFDGVEGIQQLYEDVLLCEKDTIYAFLGVGAMSPQVLSYLNLHFLPKRITMEVRAKVLMSSHDQLDAYPPYLEEAKRRLTDIRVISHEFVHIANEINIYGSNKVAFMMCSEEESSGVIIQSKQLHDTLKSIFDLVWFVSQDVGKTSKHHTKDKKYLKKK